MKIPFIALLLSLLFFHNGQGQAPADPGCYQIKKSHSGFPDLLYTTELGEKACELVAAIMPPQGQPDFQVFGYDFYPLLQFTDEGQGYKYLYNQVLAAHLATDPYFLLIAKEHWQNGGMRYRTYLKLPDFAPFDQYSAIERQALTNLVQQEIDKANTKLGDLLAKNGDKEMAGINALLEVLSGNQPLPNAFDLAGFVEINVDAGMLFNRTGQSSEDNASGFGKFHDYVGMEMADANSGFFSVKDEFVAVADALQNQLFLNGLDWRFIFTDNFVSETALKSGGEQFENDQNSKMVFWLHFFSSNSQDPNAVTKVYVKTKTNVTLEEAETVIDSYHELNLSRWYSGQAPAARHEPEYEGRSGACPSNCSASWNWGKTCLLPCVSSFGQGIGCGLLDGLLASIQSVYDSVKGIATAGTGFFVKAGSYFAELFELSFREACTKVAMDAYSAAEGFKKKVGEMIDSAIAAYEVIKKIINEMLPNWRDVVNGIAEGVSNWMNGLLQGDPAVGYDVGKLAFDVISGALSGGSTVGKKYLVKLVDFLGDLRVGPATKVKELLLKAQNSGKVDQLITRCKLLGTGCFVAGTPVWVAAAPQPGPENIVQSVVTVPIEEVQLLDYVLAHKYVNRENDFATASIENELYLGDGDKDPYTSEQQRQRDQYELDDENWNEVVFEEVYGTSVAKLALHNDWIARQSYELGAIVNMNMPEQGISGPFQVTTIRHILPQKKPVDEDPDDDYEYRPVTGLFSHRSSEVLKLQFDSGEELGVTSSHPIYSSTFGGWRSAGNLAIGESIVTKSSIVRILSRRVDYKEHQVYNLEVKNFHTFLVGASGIVVHNTGNCFSKLLDLFFNRVFGRWTRKRLAGKQWVDYIEESGIPSTDEINQLEALGARLQKRMIGLDKSPKNGRGFPGIDALIDGGNPLSLKEAQSASTGGSLLREMVEKANNLNDGLVTDHQDWQDALKNKIDGMLTARSSTKEWLKGRWQAALNDSNLKTDIIENLYIEAKDGWMKWDNKTKIWTDWN